MYISFNRRYLFSKLRLHRTSILIIIVTTPFWSFAQNPWSSSGDIISLKSNFDHVGINQPNPQFTLDINGTLNASDLLIKDSPVFLWEVSEEDLLYAGESKIGIGTSNPDELLTVDGKIHATDVVVLSSIPAPDYVFEEDYDMMSLDSLGEFIQVNSHLPYFSPADQMEEDGIPTAEFHLNLLRTIEEMVLHQIEFEKRIILLKEKNDEMKRAISRNKDK
ncbi:MAG: hypothetical protein AAFY41_09905 [Bacteroidota bacterium]